ncbi:MAG: hypothetical protein WBV69_06540 [Candidatus Sulfotelmatobacter sp.]
MEPAAGETSGRLYLKGKEDGNPIVLVAPYPFRSYTYPLLFTESLDIMRDVLSTRGAEVGQIERDRMGTRNFEIRDPEGNVIDIVESS